MISIDIDKAKALTKDRLRAERAPLLAAQDVAFQRALESGSDTAAIVAEKQRLRDVTSQVDACTTTDELRALSCAAPEPEPVVEEVVEPVVEEVAEPVVEEVVEPTPAPEGEA
jgi:outer membrane biosynthesis protein TonB